MKHLIAISVLAVLPFVLLAQKSPEWKLCYDSAQLYWGDDWQKTIPLLTRAERSALSDLGIYDDNYLTIINDLGLAYAHVNDYPNAERLLTSAITIKTELNLVSDTEFYRSMSNLAGVYADQGKYPEAKQLYRKILSGYSTQSSLDPALYWSVVRSLVRLYETQDLLDSGILVLNNLKTKSLGDNAEHQAARYEIDLARGRIYRKIRKYDDATTILETIVNDLWDKQDATLIMLYVRALQESGLLYAETGLYDKAEKSLLQGFRLLQNIQPVNNSLLTEVLNSLGSVYERLGIYDKAAVYYQNGLEVSKREYGGNALSSLTIESNLAGIHLKEENLDKSITEYEAIVNVLKKNTIRSGLFYPTVLNNLATAYRKNGNYQKATEYLGLAFSVVQEQKLDKGDLAATILNNKAVLFTALGQIDQAIQNYEMAYVLKREIYGDNSVMLMDIASNMAVVYWAQRKPDLAIPLFAKSISLAVRQINYIFPNLSENEQLQFYQRLKEDFERFCTIAVQLNKPELLTQAFSNQVVIKSLLFFTQERRRALVAAKNDSILSQQFQLLQARREQLGLFYQLSLRDQASAETTAGALEKEIDALEKAISLKTSETVAEKMMEQGIQWKDLQSRIKPDEAVVDIIRLRKYDLKTYVEQSDDRVQFGFTDSVYYAALVTTTETTKHPNLVLFKAGLEMETRFLNYYRNALTFGIADENSYEGYWKPIGASLPGKSKIYFSGDGVYHRLNLNTLIHPESGQFLVQRFDIRYLLNPGQFLEEHKTSITSRKATLFGDPLFDPGDNQNSETTAQVFAPLPGTNREIEEVNKILKGNAWATTVFLKEQATEKNLKDTNAPGILHVATHGFFSTDKVTLTTEAKKDFLFYSGLVLAGANENLQHDTQEFSDDGILTAFEVMNLNLSATHLVVLSACETGLGKIEHGEGVYGLQRSFLQAGARNIMISLWKVDDNITQQLMVKFYQYLLKQQSVHIALRQAQLDQLKETRDPVSWGGFIMIGLD